MPVTPNSNAREHQAMEQRFKDLRCRPVLFEPPPSPPLTPSVGTHRGVVASRRAFMHKWLRME